MTVKATVWKTKINNKVKFNKMIYKINKTTKMTVLLVNTLRKNTLSSTRKVEQKIKKHGFDSDDRFATN